MTLKVEIGGNDIGDAIVVAAAVVQAVGSIAAILIAVWISHRDRKEIRREAMSDRVSGLAALIFKAEHLVKGGYVVLTELGWAGQVVLRKEWREQETDRERCAAALRAIPLHELQNWELVSAVMEMEQALRMIEPATTAFLESNRLSSLYDRDIPPDPSGLAPAVNLAAEAAARIHNQAHRWSADKRARKHSIGPRVVG
ncbi:hypothetical protein [Brevundimonas sp.]|uniref:hypothetical protein n=1 Tax=Brevundimonas sp. TaxID=1871086 RepID=UPI0028A1552B|nr:hypothetical protein [Brevundimonas sp.]